MDPKWREVNNHKLVRLYMKSEYRNTFGVFSNLSSPPKCNLFHMYIDGSIDQDNDPAVFNSWSPGWRGCGQGWLEWFCPCTSSDAGWSLPALSKHLPAETDRRREEQITGAVMLKTDPAAIHKQKTNLILGGVVDLSGETLSFSVAGEQVLNLVQAQAEDLSIQVVILIPQLVVLLRKNKRKIQVEALSFSTFKPLTASDTLKDRHTVYRILSRKYVTNEICYII